jgi:hypothetical protein
VSAAHRPTAPRPDGAFWLVAAAFCVYAVAFIARTSFSVDGVRYFTLADDQMISMRYAENLASGHGLAWNPVGERIEGYTNFLWVLYMSLFHWLAVPRHAISLCVEVSGALFLLANLAVVRAIAFDLTSNTRVALIAVALTAFYVPLDNWAFQGTEVSVLTLLVTCASWWTLRAFDSDCVPWRVFVLLGVGTLVRPDMVVFAAIPIAALALADRKRMAQRLGAGAAIVGVFLAAETAFRLLYFGDPLPNTYYLKVSGFPLLPKLARGAVMMARFLRQLVPLLLAMWASGQLRRPGRRLGFLLAVFSAQAAYSVSVGGDAWEWWGGSNRFVAIAMPLFFVCAAAGMVASWDRLLAALARRKRLPPALAPTMAVTAMLVLVNHLALALPGDSLGGIKRLFLVIKPPETEADERNVRAGLMLRQFTSEQAVVGVIWAGAIPYFSQRTSVDLLGKMDRRIAREPMHMPDTRPAWAAFYPGHMKWDYDYSIGDLKPDLVQAPLWSLNGVVARPLPYLDRNYEVRTVISEWYMRKQSPHILWNAPVLTNVDLRSFSPPSVGSTADGVAAFIVPNVTAFRTAPITRGVRAFCGRHDGG